MRTHHTGLTFSLVLVSYLVPGRRLEAAVGVLIAKASYMISSEMSSCVQCRDNFESPIELEGEDEIA